jgi:hypothetical protein
MMAVTAMFPWAFWRSLIRITRFNSVGWGSVLVQVTVDSARDIKDVNLLHGVATFNSLAREALKKWRFRAATLRGKP